MFQPSDKDFKITTINMLTDLVGNEDNVQWTEGNCSREMETIKKSQMEMLEIE